MRLHQCIPVGAPSALRTPSTVHPRPPAWRLTRSFFFSSRRRHTIYIGDWSSDVCSSDLESPHGGAAERREQHAPHRVSERVPEAALERSEERRGGKACRSRGPPSH